MATHTRRRCALLDCRKQFRQTRSTHLFCSDKCRVYANRQASQQTPIPIAEHRPRKVSYVEALSHVQIPTDTYRDDLPSDEEYMKTLVGIVLPNGFPTIPPEDEEESTEEPIDMEVTILNVPTRIPGTTPDRGRQLTG